MATYPALEPAGPAYRVQLWNGNLGGIPIIVGVPQSPALPGFEARLWEFAQALAADVGAQITSITRYVTDSAELPVPAGT